MYVKRKYGKHQVEVSGTPSQIDEYISKWLTEIKEGQEDKMVEVCTIIRQMAINMEWEDAKSVPILDLIKH